MPRTAPIAILLAASAVAAGCGSQTPGHDTHSNGPAARAVIDQYRWAVHHTDGATACSLLSDMAKEDVQRNGAMCSTRLTAVVRRDRAQTGGIVVRREGEAWKVTGSRELSEVRATNP